MASVVAADNSIDVSEASVPLQLLHELWNDLRNWIESHIVSNARPLRQRRVGRKERVLRQALVVQSCMKASNPAPNGFFDVDRSGDDFQAAIGGQANHDAELVMTSIYLSSMQHTNKLPDRLIFRGTAFVASPMRSQNQGRGAIGPCEQS